MEQRTSAQDDGVLPVAPWTLLGRWVTCCKQYLAQHPMAFLNNLCFPCDSVGRYLGAYMPATLGW